MKKYIIGIIISICIICSVPIAHAETIGYFRRVTYDSTLMSYESLSYLCTTVNEDLANGEYGSIVGNHPYVTLFDGGNDRVYIALYNTAYPSGNSPYFLCDSSSTGRYYATPRTDDSYDLKPIKDWLVDIYTKCNSINNNILTVNNYLNSISTYCGTITNHLSNIQGYSAYIPVINNNIASTNTKLDTIISNMNNQSQFNDSNIVSSVNQVHTDLIGISDKMFKPHYNISARSPGTSVAYIPRMSAEMMVAYYNIFMFGEKVQPVAYPADQQATFYHAYIDDDGFLKAHCWIANIGEYADFYMITRFDAYCITDSSSSTGAFDDTRIVNAVNRIYDWLDNADLATNTTITNVVQNSTNEVINALPNFDRVRGLFTAAFGDMDNSHNLTDWGSAISYFGNLWSDQ